MSTALATTPAKPFAWSYSRLKNFETCPFRHQQIDIEKAFKDDESEQLLWGNRVHDALAKRLGPRKTPLPADMPGYEKWAKRIEEIANQSFGTIKTELKFAVDRQFQPCPYFGREVWLRGIADAMVVAPPYAVAIDWKTGKIVEDSQQLALTAQLVFSHYPEITHVGSAFIWLAEDCETIANYDRDDMPRLWNALMPRVDRVKSSHDSGIYVPTPSGLCKRHCPVASCQFYQKGRQ